jgi:hypothetical protein
MGCIGKGTEGSISGNEGWDVRGGSEGGKRTVL